MTRDDIFKKYGTPDPNKKNMFINYDAIDDLPDELEPVISEFKFDPGKLSEYFSNVGSEKKPSWYPKTDLMYKIADMCGISGCEKSIIEWISNEVDINPMLMKPFGSEPTMRNIITSARVTKQSKVLCEDGNFRLSSPESNEFDFFTRACLDFVSEEDKTNNYTTGKKEYYRYNAPKKREKRYLELKKFAIQQAETKAFCKTIRVLAGLPTGFETKDLKDGKLVFIKFIKSKRLQKMETAARLQAISQGKTGMIEDMSGQLFGTPEIEAPISDNFDNQDIPPVPPPRHPEKKNPFKDQIKPKTKQQPKDEKTKIKEIIKAYVEKKDDNPNYKILENTQGALDYIRNVWKTWKDITLEEAKHCLQLIEEVQGIIKIEHDINLGGKDVF